MTNFTIIYAHDDKNGIGRNNKLPWYFPEDLKRFKELTYKTTILMGRKTWESLPKKPLPYRKNVVLTSNKDFKVDDPDTIIINDWRDAWQFHSVNIIGGTQIYKLFESYVTSVFETHIFGDFGCDTFYNFDYTGFFNSEVCCEGELKFAKWVKI